ncbi:MAG TPA: hypothetical protein VGS19_38990 [Streptosporangiaceae bacterium]|nr:hypothetical protein [Streptosporangiaceae bacterium]
MTAGVALTVPVSIALMAGPAAAGTGGTATSPPFNECPAVGSDTSCGVLFIINPDGSVTVLTDPSQGPFDTPPVEDTLIGVLNNSNFPVTSLQLTSTSGAFGFDGDGICSSATSPEAPGCPFSTTNTMYEGPDNTFTVADANHGTVDFTGSGLQPGASTYFGLEGNVTPGSLEFPLAAQGVAVSATEGMSFSGNVATFTDSDASDPADSASNDSATIDWGDGNTSTGTVSQTGPGQFSVSGTHTYADEGSYNVNVSISDPDDPGGPATATSAATVADAPLSATGSPDFVSTNPVSGTLATFTDANPGATTADFTTGGGSTTVDWGDGNTTPGTVTQTGPGQFSVSGTHTYATLGPETITISIVDDGGSTATAQTHVVVFAFARGGSFVIGNGNSAIGTAVTFWGAQWAKDNTLSGGSAPNSFKGFEDGANPPRCGSGWTTDPGNSTPPPSGSLPSYMGVIVSSSITKSGPTISGDTPHIVVVTTNPGYQPNPGHAGTGTVVAQAC